MEGNRNTQTQRGGARGSQQSQIRNSQAVGRSTGMRGTKMGTQSHRRSAVGKGTARSSRMTGERGTKRGGATVAAGEAGPPVVWDETGTVDVTPKPLTSLKPSVLGAKGNLLLSMDKSGHTHAEGSPTSESNNDTFDRSSQSGFSVRGGGYSSSSPGGSTTSGGTATSTAQSSPRGEDELHKEAGARKKEVGPEPKKLVAKFDQAPEVPLTELELNRNVYIMLKETDTFWLLEIPAQCVGNESQEAPAVEAANERYTQILKEREGSEMFTEVATQTLDKLKKSKEAQTLAKDTKSSDCQVTVWDIVDALEEEEAGDGAEELTVADKTKPSKDFTAAELAAASDVARNASAANTSGTGTHTNATGTAAPSMTTTMVNGGSMVAGVAPPAAPAPQAPVEGALEGAEAEAEPVKEVDLSRFDNLPGILTIMERAVTQNIYHDRMLHYRDFRPRKEAPLPPPPEDPELPSDTTRAMHHLWDFQCDLTRGRNVSCMASNKLRKDILAVGYGQYEFSHQKDGMVAFWSLKNPDYPDWVFRSPTGVTALAFSAQQPSLLAVGFYDGMVAIYDVRAPTDKPSLESGHASGKHSDPVWKLQWVQRSSEGGEHLVSISTDGRVTQWSIKKGLEHQDLMKLKRVHRRTIPKEAIEQLASTATGNTKTEAFISRRSSGMCFDFCPKDPNMYVVGTEDGNIHKCSCSYSEQYLESYFGHSGPLYQIQWSPFAHNLFLSSSADWTVKLWAEDNDNALITFQSGNEEVSDLQWSPTNSTVIGTVTCDGRLEMWDLSESTQKPVLVHQLEGVKLSCILFSEADPIVLCGGDNGAVSVFRMVGVEHPDSSPEEELQRLEDAMSSNIVSTTDADAKDQK